MKLTRRSDEAAQELSWSELEKLQGWELHNLFHCFTILTVRK